jgi:REP element-mobilizing transposase RayT
MDNILYKNKYRIKSTRLKYWDYSSGGIYYVTICTKNREYFFGNIINGQSKLSIIGEIVSNEWVKTEQIRKHVLLDEYIVMPNHLHGIVIIQNHDVETHGHASLQTQHKNKFGPQSKNLPAIIRGFKGTTTKQIHNIGFNNFAWQPRYYEHIIRNEKDLNRVREYIRNNPLQWQFDKENIRLSLM